MSDKFYDIILNDLYKSRSFELLKCFNSFILIEIKGGTFLAFMRLICCSFYNRSD